MDFTGFPKIARFNREVIVTEKIDGTNAQIHIDDTGAVLTAGSRNKWITPTDDNAGFARWASENTAELLRLGPGSHFGEWWGAGIQRRYGLTEKRFSLFNVSRWGDDATRPACCGVVPTLWRGNFEDIDVAALLADLATGGSRAAPGFMKPEGIVIFHVASGALFKKTIEKDEQPKGQAAA
jgi:hypothetical protein